MTRLQNTVLWLFVINLGIAFGAGLYESSVVIPPWAGMPIESWPNTGIRFWAYVTTVPLSLLTLASLYLASRSIGPDRSWWFAAALVVLMERIATFAYFIPTMVRLQRGSGMPDEETLATLAQWTWLNYGRHVLTLAGWLIAMRALTLRRGL
jgi:hypothetical protein